jgi:hypothetical protein
VGREAPGTPGYPLSRSLHWLGSVVLLRCPKETSRDLPDLEGGEDAGIMAAKRIPVLREVARRRGASCGGPGGASGAKPLSPRGVWALHECSADRVNARGIGLNRGQG